MPEQSTLRFKFVFERLAPLFVVLTLGMYAYVWNRYPNVLEFLRHVFTHQVPLLAAHTYLAFMITLNQNCVSPGEAVGEDEFSWEEELWINPGTGAPMIGGVGGVDVLGYPFGSGPGD
jgi:hypothetical protein